ncbi:MAG: tetratricopeptide repeat protein, partial [Methermicoccaceae archaeon]
PDNVYVLYAKGNCLYQLKEYNAAVEYYSQALNLDPTNYVLLNNMGNAYYALKDFDKAVEYYSQALNLSPPDAIDSVASNLLDAQYAAGDYDGAEKTLTIIKELRIPAILSEADGLFNRGDYTEAADKYSSALELNSSQATVWYALAFCQYLLGDYEDAVTSANRALLLLSPLSAKGAVISTQGDMVVGKPVSIKISSPGDVALTIEPSDGIWVNGISYFAPVVLDGNDECEVVFSTSGDYLLSVGAGHERAFSSIHITGEDERKSTYGHINDYLMVFVVGIILGVFVGYAVRFGKRLGKEE